MCAFQVMHGSCKDFPSAPDKGAHAPPAIDQTATFVVPPRPPRGCCRLAMGPWLGSHHNFEFAFWAHLPYVHMVCCAARISGAAARAGWHRHFSPAPVLFFQKQHDCANSHTLYKGHLVADLFRTRCSASPQQTDNEWS